MLHCTHVWHLNCIKECAVKINVKTATMVYTKRKDDRWVVFSYWEPLLSLHLLHCPVRVAKYVISLFVHLSTCSSVCSSVHLAKFKNHVAKLHQIFYVCCPWWWLAHVLKVLRYVMYFRLYGWCHIFIPWDLYVDWWAPHYVLACRLPLAAINTWHHPGHVSSLFSWLRAISSLI